MAKRGRPKGSTKKATAKKTVAKKKSKKTAKKAVSKRGRPKGSKNKPQTAKTAKTASKKVVAKKRGRPKGSKNKAKEIASEAYEVSGSLKRGRGRPKGSKNKPKIITSTQKKSAKQISEEILKTQKPSRKAPPKAIDEILFKVPYVTNPLQGTPKEVQRELDNLAKSMQNNPEDSSHDVTFDRIHHYMHTYLVSVVMKKFPFIKGYQQVDIYQETLIALRFKAIEGFKKKKGMSFLNFAKLCIRRHLITLLNQSKNGLKSKAMNSAISLESTPNNNDDSDGRNTFANTIGDGKDSHDEEIAKSEAFRKTKEVLANQLSEFERIVLDEYLSGSPYKEISVNISLKTGEKCGTKRVDNALLRIRKKAMHLMKHSKTEDIPMFLNQKDVDNHK
jgi:RNA polymerase sporulation-specific sigma factor